MDRRQRILIAVLVLMFVGYLGDQAYRRLYEQPLAAAEERAAALEQELHEGTLAVRRNQNRLPELDQLKVRSLPSNNELAVTEYRSWLLKAIDESGLEQANLDSGTPARFRDLYTRIDFSLRTQGTLSQVTQLLHTFYNTDYLHKIRSLSLTPTSEGIVDVSMTIETLSIPAVASPDQLPTPHHAPTELTAPLDDYHVIARRNLFRPGDPPAASIKLSAITSGVAQQHEAWLSFLQTGETRILSEGDAFNLDGSSLRVIRIEAETVEFEIDGQRRSVRIGHTLDPDAKSRTLSPSRLP